MQAHTRRMIVRLNVSLFELGRLAFDLNEFNPWIYGQIRGLKITKKQKTHGPPWWRGNKKGLK